MTTDGPHSKESPQKIDSLTITTESGAFIRKTYRKGGRRKQETIRLKPNQKKVVLGHVGDFEVYVYPYDFPDKVFIGDFPVSTTLVRQDIKKLMGLCHTMMWFVDGKAFSEPNWRKAVNSRKRDIQTAYNLGLNDQRSKENASFSPNYNYTTRGKNRNDKEKET